MINAVIFDMDGVLVDSEPFWRRAEINAVARFGGSITEAQTYQTTGLRIDEIGHYRIRTCGLDPACHAPLCNAMVEEVIEQIHSRGQLLPGVNDALNWLAQTDLKIGLASSSPMRMIEAVMQAFELHPYFTVQVSAEKLEFGKPHPQVYLDAAAQLGVEAQCCLAIEDSVNGLIAAKAARMTAICVPEPGQEENPRFGIADLKLASLNEFVSPAVRDLLGK